MKNRLLRLAGRIHFRKIRNRFLFAKGLYRFYINGQEGSDQLFAPGFTSYYTRLQV
jgi:Alpha-L-rhamnosidase N-terminal domain.